MKNNIIFIGLFFTALLAGCSVKNNNIQSYTEQGVKHKTSVSTSTWKVSFNTWKKIPSLSWKVVKVETKSKEKIKEQKEKIEIKKESNVQQKISNLDWKVSSNIDKNIVALKQELEKEFKNYYTSEDSNHYENKCYILVDINKDDKLKITIYRNKWVWKKSCVLNGVEKVWVIQRTYDKTKKEYILKSYNKKDWTFKYIIYQNNLLSWDNFFTFVFHTKKQNFQIDLPIMVTTNTNPDFVFNIKRKYNKNYKEIIFSSIDDDIAPTIKYFVNFTSLWSWYYAIITEKDTTCVGATFYLNFSDKLKSILLNKFKIKSKLNINNIIYNKDKGKTYIIPHWDEQLKKAIIHNKVYSSKTFKEEIYKDIKAKNKLIDTVMVKYDWKDYNLPFDVYVKYTIDPKFIIVKYFPWHYLLTYLLDRSIFPNKTDFKIKIKDLPLKKPKGPNSKDRKADLLFPETDAKDDDILSCKILNKDYFMCKPTRKLQTFAELCKPAIYTYNWNGENKVNLTLPQWWYYTKLIPEFNITSGWEYVSKNNKVIFGNKQYPYLYYAVKVKNYKFNKYGWIVKWEDIEKFFKEKLEKIWFNKQEEKDFIEYWTHKYKKGHYYFVSFKYTQEFDKYVKLKFEKKPNIINRVLMESYEVSNYNKDYLYPSKYEKYLDSKIIKKLKRGGKKEIFEWWGTLIDLYWNSYIF